MIVAFVVGMVATSIVGYVWGRDRGWDAGVEHGEQFGRADGFERGRAFGRAETAEAYEAALGRVLGDEEQDVAGEGGADVR